MCPELSGRISVFFTEKTGGNRKKYRGLISYPEKRGDNMININWRKVGIFAGGAVLGIVGVKLLSGRDAKKVYTHCTAAALRAKDYIVDQATILQENCADIYEEAKKINEDRAAEEKEKEIDDEPKGIEDKSGLKTETDEEDEKNE